LVVHPSEAVAERLALPAAVFSRSEALTSKSLVPAAPGLYAWFFREVPPAVPTSGCQRLGDLTLLYVGISPSRPTSRQSLRKRIRYRYRGNAEGSTLRLTLGVLLAEPSGFPLRRVGSGKRMTFTHLGEQWLDAWMEANAFVTWVEHPEPWAVEAGVFARLSLPLNLQDNEHHAFHALLSAKRAEAKRRAAKEPIASEHNKRRARGRPELPVAVVL
jgi:hypothetical protein